MHLREERAALPELARVLEEMEEGKSALRLRPPRPSCRMRTFRGVGAKAEGSTLWASRLFASASSTPKYR